MRNVLPLVLPAKPSSIDDAASSCPSLDGVFRVGRHVFQAMANGGTQSSTVVHACGQSLNAFWSETAGEGIRSGDLVRLRLSEWSHLDGDLVIELAGLTHETQPDTLTNLFLTVPPEWAIERRLLERGARLWEALAPGHRALFNAIFWDADRFQRYLTYPLYVRYPHSLRSSLFDYSLEIAELSSLDVDVVGPIDRSLIRLCALLYVAGQIDLWIRPIDGETLAWAESGDYVGHRLIVFAWIVLAYERYSIPLSGTERLAINNLLMATDGISDENGLPKPMAIEKTLLQSAHSICRRCEFHGRA